MIIVLRGDRSGDKEEVLMRFPKDVLREAESLIRGERGPGLVEFVKLGIQSHKASGKDIEIDIPRPSIKRKPAAPAPSTTTAAAATVPPAAPTPSAPEASAVAASPSMAAPAEPAILAELAAAATGGTGFGRTRAKTTPKAKE